MNLIIGSLCVLKRLFSSTKWNGDGTSAALGDGISKKQTVSIQEINYSWDYQKP